MKLLLKIFVLMLVLCVGSIALLYFKPQLAEGIAKYLVEQSLSKKDFIVRIDKVDLSKESTTFHNITIKNNESQVAKVDSIVLSYDLLQVLKKQSLVCDLRLSKFAMDDMEFNASARIKYGDRLKSVSNLKLDFKGGGLFELDAVYKTILDRPYSVEAKGRATDLPLMLHKAFWNLIPDDEIVMFLREYINHGYLSGEWNVNLDRGFFGDYKISSENLSGKFTLKDIGLRYDPEYPALQNLDSDVDLSGTKLTFEVKRGYSGKVALYDGTVALDFEKGVGSEVVIKTKGKGPALDLVSFIPRSAIESLQKSKIDLTKIAGSVDVDFGMIIPLAPEINNLFDVKAVISGAGLKVFDDNVELSNALLNGTFDGKAVAIDGKGKVNGFDSDLSYKFNFDEAAEFENLLDIKLKFTPLADRKQINLSAIDGKSIVNIAYKSKNNKGKLTANSNLKNVEFFVEKLGIYKDLGIPATLQIDSSGDDVMPSKLDIKIVGGDGLRILGALDLGEKSTRLNLSQVKYLNTDIKADLVFGNHSLKATVSGSSLDLSRGDMMNFISKNSNGQETDLKVNIAKIRMKNDIWLDDFALHIKCDKKKCYAGKMDSMVGSQVFGMGLTSSNNDEHWTVNTTNAGAILKGLDMYKTMKSGNMILEVESSRQDVAVGEPISIINGTFSIEKFITTDNPVLTRMVSFISLPGMMSAITNNHNIRFEKMAGKFGFKDGILKIEDGGAEGAYFDFTMAGTINTNERVIKLKGSIVPSLYGINTLLKHIPIVGTILSGGHRKGLVSAPYFIKNKY